MKEEVCAAVSFLTRLVGKTQDMSDSQMEDFQKTLTEILMEKFKDHWFPEKPHKGQAYRCIRVNGNERRDSTLEKAAEKCGLRYEDLNLPVELTVWVDPQEVCCRFGENEGSYCTVACFKDNKENLSNNINPSHESSPECQKKQKGRRKQSEKPKKPATTRNSSSQPNPMKGFNPKSFPLISPKGMPPTFNGYFDWQVPPCPISSRFARVNGLPDSTPFGRRPKRSTARSFYQPNDRYHWARK